MNHRKLLTYIFILTITISIAHADLEPGDVDVHVEELTGEDVTYINPDVPKLVNLVFSFDRNAEFESISIETSEMNPSSTVEYGFVESQAEIRCEENQSTYNCRVDPAELNLEGGTSFNVTVTVEGEEVKSGEKEITFEADTENPRILDVSTQHCSDGTCYLSPRRENTVTAEMSETPSGYASSDINVEVQFQGNTFPAFCDGTVCEAPVQGFTCDDGEEEQMTVTGEDSAGNPVQEDKQVNVTCLASLPNVKDLAITPGNEELGFTNVDPIEIQAVVGSPSSPTMDMAVNATDLNGDISSSSCEPRTGSEEFECNTTINPEVPSAGTYSIPVTFSDAAGNEYREVKTVEIAEVVENVPEDEEGETLEGDIWEMTGYETDVDTLNARNMYHDRRIPVTFNLQQDSIDGLELADAEYSGTCRNIHGDTNRSDVNSIDVIDTDEDSIQTLVKLRGSGNVQDNRYEEHNRIEYECEMSMTSRDGNKIYGTPTVSNVSFDFDIEVDDHITSNVVNQINRTENTIDRQENYLKALKTSAALGESLCSMYQMAETGRAAWGYGHAALAGTNKALGGVLSGAVSSSRAGLESYGRATEKVGSKFKPVCEFMACQLDIQRKVPEFLGNPGGVLGDMPDQLDEAVPGEGWGGALDPYQSEVIAYGSACLPAITNHVIERREIQCQYHNCLNKQTNNMGIPEGICTAQKAQAQCVKTARSIENALPVVSIGNYFRNSIAQIIGNPEAALLSLGELGFEQLCESGGSASQEIYGICQGEQGRGRSSKLSDLLFDISTNVVGRIESLSGSPRIGSSSGGQQVPKSACEQMTRLEQYSGIRQSLFERRTISEGELQDLGGQTINPGTLVELDGVTGQAVMGASEIILSDKYYGKYPSKRDADSIGEIAWYNIKNGEFLGMGDEVRNREDFPDVNEQKMKEIRDDITEKLTNDIERQSIAEIDEVTSEVSTQEEKIAQRKRNLAKLEQKQKGIEQIDQQMSEASSDAERQALEEMKSKLENDIDDLQEQTAEEVEPADVEELDTGEIDISEEDLAELQARDPSPGYGEYARNFMDGVRGFSQFKTTLEAMTGADLDFFNTRDLANDIRSVSPLAEAACNTRIDPYSFDGRTDDSGVSLEDNDGVSQDAIGTSSVFLTGLKQEVPDGYEYYVSFAVNSPDQNLDVQVQLEDGTDVETITQDVLNSGETVTAPAGGSVGKTPEPAQLQRSKDYNRVCIKFLPDGSLSDYFDSTEALNNNKFCQQVVEE